MKKLILCILLCVTNNMLAGCGIGKRLSDVGRSPTLSAIENPVTQAGYKPVSMPMPEPSVAHYNPNSLWKSGNRSFFKDQRAARIGDILTVVVRLNDSAKFDNTTERSRKSGEDLGLSGAAGAQLDKILNPVSSLSSAVDLSSNSNAKGSGSVDRSETLTTTIAGVVTQVLPNGNLVIEGRQEVRVNFELRELIVAGVVRPEDIGSDNTIDSTKIAQARISYGGRGQITDIQQPRYGQQIYDILMPF